MSMLYTCLHLLLKRNRGQTHIHSTTPHHSIWLAQLYPKRLKAFYWYVDRSARTAFSRV